MLRSGEDDGEEDDEVFALLPLDDDVLNQGRGVVTLQECSCAVTTSDAEMMSENPSRRSNVSKRISLDPFPVVVVVVCFVHSCDTKEK